MVKAFMEKRELWRCLQISFGRPGVDSGNFSKRRSHVLFYISYSLSFLDTFSFGN